MRGYESSETCGKDAESRRSLIWSDTQMEKKIVMTPNLPYLDLKPENVTGSFYLINL